MLNSKEETPMQQALRNPIILKLTFSCLPTGFLLNSCSLVDKTWNRLARTFIWNQRQCTARYPRITSSTPNPCGRLQKLASLCQQMSKNSRVIPFNRIHFYLYDHERLGPNCGIANISRNKLPAELKLKFLSICSSSYADCPVHKPLQSIVHHSASEVRSMTVDSSILVESLVCENPRHFPQLQEISVEAKDSWNLEVQKQLFGALLKHAPKLRKISARNHDALRVVPKEMYGLLSSLLFSYRDESIFRTIIEQRPKLKELEICKPVDSEGFGQRFKNVFTLFLRTFQETLASVRTTDFRLLTDLAHCRLTNVFRLELAITDSERRLDEFWNVISSTNASAAMPKVVEIKVCLYNVDEIFQWPKKYLCSEKASHEYVSVRKLSLNVSNLDLNMNALRSIFPSVSSFALALTDASYLPCQEIWKIWPELESFEAYGVVADFRHGYDAQFCGITEEEVELLHSLTRADLQNVHIVPIRPSVLTMHNLRKLELNLTLVSAEHADPSAGLKFISKVAKLVALRRMPTGVASVSWTVEPFENFDDDDVGYDFNLDEDSD